MSWMRNKSTSLVSACEVKVLNWFSLIVPLWKVSQHLSGTRASRRAWTRPRFIESAKEPNSFMKKLAFFGRIVEFVPTLQSGNFQWKNIRRVSPPTLQKSYHIGLPIRWHYITTMRSRLLANLQTALSKRRCALRLRSPIMHMVLSSG